jgi:hypothetical protein
MARTAKYQELSDMPIANPNATNALTSVSTPEAIIGFQPISQSGILLQNGIPFVTPASGTISATGALSGMGVALPTTYANAYFFFPASALSTTSAAGWYFTQMTSTTAGTVFQNTYTSGIPSIPLTSTRVAVTAGQGAYTQVSTTNTAISFTIPANALGPNGKLRYSMLQTNNNSAGIKFVSVTIGSTLAYQTGMSGTSISNWVLKDMMNAGSTGSQSYPSQGAPGPIASTGAGLWSSIDTTQSFTVVTKHTLNTPATDAVTNEFFSIELLVP